MTPGRLRSGGATELQKAEIAVMVVALVIAVALLLTGCGSTSQGLNRQFAAAQAAHEKSMAGAALASERARVSSIHEGH
jgi:starvation-inducible outer membrane lipoprotein